MGRSFSATRGRSNSVTFASMNALVQARQLRNAALNGIIQVEIIKTASLNAFVSLFTQYELAAALNANVILNPILSGLQSYWKLDGDSTDSTGLGNGTDTAVTYSAAKINSGGVFNGTTSKIVIAENAAYKPTVFSCSAWIKTSASGIYGDIFASTRQDASKVGGFEVRVNTANKLEVVVGNNTNLVQGSGYQFGASTASVNTGAFVHVAATYDGSNIRTYINGAADGVTAWAGGIAFQTDTRVRIGMTSHVTLGELSFFNGTIDEVGYWNRVLTAGEVTILYNAGSGIQYPF